MKYIKDLHEGEKVSGIYMVKSRVSAMTKNGKNYDNVVISDVDFGPKDFSEVNQQPIGNATVQPAPTQVQQTPPQAAPQQPPVQNQVAQAPQQHPIQNPPVQQPVYQQAPTGDPGFEPPLGVNGF